ncbi:MAG: histidine phosphatase family protein [Synechococcales cyanobacterium RM1_1_8]|nr:histidine phosphatase family protein [Synechococcales cyanobacterium RM1_1_8]
MTWQEAQQRYPQLCAQLEATPDWLPIPQAESPRDSRRRARGIIQQWLAQHRPADSLWVISHGGFLAHLVSELLGCDRTWGCQISHTGLFEFEFDLQRWNQAEQNRFNTALWKINRFNSTEHLNE